MRLCDKIWSPPGFHTSKPPRTNTYTPTLKKPCGSYIYMLYSHVCVHDAWAKRHLHIHKWGWRTESTCRRLQKPSLSPAHTHARPHGAHLGWALGGSESLNRMSRVWVSNDMEGSVFNQENIVGVFTLIGLHVAEYSLTFVGVGVCVGVTNEQIPSSVCN